MDKHAIVRHSSRPVDQYRLHNFHYQFDEKPKHRTPIMPCSPQQQPITPRPYYDYHKSRKSTSSSAKRSHELSRRNSSANINDLYSPPGSSRYLLDDPPLIDFSSESDSSYGSTLVATSQPLRPQRRLINSNEHSRVLAKSFSTRAASSTESPVFSSSPSSSRSRSTESPVVKSFRSRLRDQVVELRVSIHCKGCEGKVRKHLSRMEGVKSFYIDLATKKVTVIGDVTPLSVLSSISKVKSAQFWPSPTSSSSSSSSPMVGRRY